MCLCMGLKKQKKNRVHTIFGERAREREEFIIVIICCVYFRVHRMLYIPHRSSVCTLYRHTASDTPSIGLRAFFRSFSLLLFCIICRCEFGRFVVVAAAQRFFFFFFLILLPSAAHSSSSSECVYVSSRSLCFMYMRATHIERPTQRHTIA